MTGGKAKAGLVAALILTMGVAALMASSQSVKASGGDPTSAIFFLNDLGTPDSANCGTASAPVLGSLDSTVPATGDIGSPTNSGEFCTSTSGAYGGSTLAITSVSVTLYLDPSSSPPVSLNSTLLNSEPSGTLLAYSGYSSTPSWTLPGSCVSQTFTLTPQPGAQLTAGDLSATFFFVLTGSPSISESPQVCTGGSWPSFVNITGTPQSTSTTPSISTTTTTVTSVVSTTVVSTTLSTFTTTLASTTQTVTETFTTTVVTSTTSQQASNGPLFLTLPSTRDSFELLSAAISGESLVNSQFIVQAECIIGGQAKYSDFMVIEFGGGATISHYSVTGNSTENSGIPKDHLIIPFNTFKVSQSPPLCSGPTIRYYLDLTSAGIKGPSINKWFAVESFSWGYPTTEP